MFERLLSKSFELKFLSHAKAILSRDFPDAVKELERALENFSIPIEEIIGSGGGVAAGTQRLRNTLSDMGWCKTKCEIKKVIDNETKESITHEIDHVKVFSICDQPCKIALEIEWNNKDPFFDRDLENFKRLHTEGIISVGIIITRGSGLQSNLLNFVRRFAAEGNVHSYADLNKFGVKKPTERQEEMVTKCVALGKTFQDCWSKQFVDDKFGTATTHWQKLIDRVNRGVGNPCPMLLIGLPPGIITFD